MMRKNTGIAENVENSSAIHFNDLPWVLAAKDTLQPNEDGSFSCYENDGGAIFLIDDDIDKLISFIQLIKDTPTSSVKIGIIYYIKGHATPFVIEKLDGEASMFVYHTDSLAIDDNLIGTTAEVIRTVIKKISTIATIYSLGYLSDYNRQADAGLCAACALFDIEHMLKIDMYSFSASDKNSKKAEENIYSLEALPSSLVASMDSFYGDEKQKEFITFGGDAAILQEIYEINGERLCIEKILDQVKNNISLEEKEYNSIIKIKAKNCLELYKKKLLIYSGDELRNHYFLNLINFTGKDGENIKKRIHDVARGQKLLFISNLKEFYKKEHNRAVIFFILGNYAEALQILKTICENKKQLFNTYDINLLSAKNSMASALMRLGRYEEALALYDEIYRGCKKSVGIGDIRWAALSNLGTVYYFLGDTESAKHYWDKMVIIKENSYWNAIRLFNLGKLEGSAGCLYKAKEALQQASRIFKQCTGNGSIEIIATLNELGLVYAKLREYKGAVSILQEALNTSSRYEAGAYFLEIARIHNNLGLVYSHWGCSDNRESLKVKGRFLLEKALGTKQLHCGADELELASTLKDLGYAHHCSVFLADDKKSKKLLEQALEIINKYYKNRNDHRLVNLHGILSEVYGCLGEFPKQCESSQHALSIEASYCDEDDPSLISRLEDCGKACLNNCWTEMSIILFKQEQKILTKNHFGVGHKRVVNNHWYLNKAGEALKEHDDGAVSRRWSLKIQK